MKNTRQLPLLLLLVAFTTMSFANPFAKPSEPNGILSLNTPHTSQDIFPVSLYEIDGKNIVSRSNAVWLKPGKHRLKMRANVDLSYRSHALLTRNKSLNKNNRILDITVEDGKTYYIGYDTSNNNPNLWKPVIWKVK